MVASWPFFTQISGRFPYRTLWRGPSSIWNCPSLQAQCCALCSTEQTAYRGGEKGEKVPRKGEEEGWSAKRAKRKKDTWKQVSFSSENRFHLHGDSLLWTGLQWAGHPPLAESNGLFACWPAARFSSSVSLATTSSCGGAAWPWTQQWCSINEVAHWRHASAKLNLNNIGPGVTAYWTREPN